MSETCPDCGDEFDTDRGVKVHHSKVHDGSLGRTTVQCAWCEDEKEVVKGHAKRCDKNFCDSECQWKYRHENQTQHGENHHNWGGGMVELECLNCGSPFEIKPYKLEEEDKGKYCSRECHYSHRIENGGYEGENNPAWKGGFVYTYGRNWPEQREKRLERDKYQCVVCSISNEEHKQRHDVELHVHHIQRKEKFRDDSGRLDYERANRLENLITLCYSCHSKWEGIPVAPVKGVCE